MKKEQSIPQPRSGVLLDKETHKDAVAAFGRHFAISRGSPDATLLEDILQSFSRLPYENLSKIIKYRQNSQGAGRIRLPEEVMEGHIRYRLGGTCFSLTFFLDTILSQRGFVCYPVMANMRWAKNVHCALIVLLDGKKHLVDPGYLLSRPMALSQDQPRLYKTSFSGVQLIYYAEESAYDLYTFDKIQTKWRYRFWDEPVSPEAFLDHWMASFGWNSMHGLCLTRVEKNRIVYVHKTFMRETSFGKKRNVNIKNDVHGAIHRVFGIAPELVEEALAAVEDNMAREREGDLFLSRKTWRPMS